REQASRIRAPLLLSRIPHLVPLPLPSPRSPPPLLSPSSSRRHPRLLPGRRISSLFLSHRHVRRHRCSSRRPRPRGAIPASSLDAARMATGRCGRTEHAPEHRGLWFGFSTGGRLCAWDDSLPRISLAPSSPSCGLRPSALPFSSLSHCQHGSRSAVPLLRSIYLLLACGGRRRSCSPLPHNSSRLSVVSNVDVWAEFSSGAVG
uniref:Uncharacterized protein n=7 Tax=Aegilops tauschii subsp. strangulata TaxID=200361 RepID=A0A453CRP5_AEGTS